MLAHKERVWVKPPAELLVKRDETALAGEQCKVDSLLIEEFDGPANAPRRQSLPSGGGVRLHSTDAPDLCQRIIHISLTQDDPDVTQSSAVVVAADDAPCGGSPL